MRKQFEIQDLIQQLQFLQICIFIFAIPVELNRTKQKLKMREIIQNRQSYSQSKDVEIEQIFNEEDSKHQNSNIFKQQTSKLRTNTNNKLLNIQKLYQEECRLQNDQTLKKLINLNNNVLPNQLFHLNNISFFETYQQPQINQTPLSFIGYDKKSQNKILNLIEEVSDNISLGVAIFNSSKELIYTNNTMTQHFIQFNSQKKSVKQELLQYCLDNKNFSSLALKINSQKQTKTDGGINRSITMGPSIKLIQNSSQIIKQMVNSNFLENFEFFGDKLKKSYQDLEDKNINRKSSKKKTNSSQSNENFEDSDTRFGKQNLITSNKSIFVRGSSLIKFNLNKNNKIKEKLNSGLCTLGELVQIMTDLNNYRKASTYKSAQILQYPYRQPSSTLKRGKSQEEIRENENEKQNLKKARHRNSSNISPEYTNTTQTFEQTENYLLSKIDYQIQANQVVITTKNKHNEKILIKFKAFYIKETSSSTNNCSPYQQNLETSQNSYCNPQFDEINTDQNMQEEEYDESKQGISSSNVIVIVEFCKNNLFGNDFEQVDIKDEINNYKKRILSSVSHELKTPLNCSIQLLDLLYQSDAIEEVQKKMFIEPALNSNQLLLCMINDILDFALIEKGELKLTFKSFSIINLIRECISYFIIQAASKDIQIELNFDQNIPQIINSDEMRVKQVVISLLSNAIKFTQFGNISINVDCILQPNPTSTPTEIVKISVSDTGCGIEQQALKNIFEGLMFNKQEYSQQSMSFFMGPQKRRETQTNKEQQKKLNTEGAGLGLSIANNIAKGLGGNRKIEVQSQLGKGSTFSFYIVNRSHKSKGCEINNYKFMSQTFSQWRSFQSKEITDQVSLNDNYNSSCLKSDEISNNCHSNGLITYNLNNKGVTNNQRISLSISSNNIENSAKNLDLDDNQVDSNTCQFSSSKSPYKLNRPRNLFFQSNQMASNSKFQGESIQQNFIQEDSCEIMSEMNSHKHISLPNQPIIPTLFSNYYQTSLLHNNKSDVSLKSLVDAQLSQQECFPQNSNNLIRIKDLELQQMQNNFQIFLKSFRSFSIQKINTNSVDNINHSENAKINNQICQIKQDSSQASSNFMKINKSGYQQSITSLKQIGGISCKVLPTQSSHSNLQRAAINCSITNFDQQNNNTNNLVETNNQKIRDLEQNMAVSSQTKKDDIQQIKNVKSLLKEKNQKRKCVCSNILIVDDNQFNLHALQLKLKHYDFTIDIANSGIEAINKVQDKFEKSICCKQYRLIFMDIDMPIKNGYQTTKEIINYFNAQKVIPTKISACTAYIQESEKKQAKESGMKYYITKPVGTEQLEEVLFKVFLQKKL